MRRSSALVATDPQGRFLLQHRTDDAPTWPGYWGLFGGGEEPGETARDALLRELREELDLDVSDAAEAGQLIAEGFPVGAFVLSVFHLRLDLLKADPWRLLDAMTEGQNLGFYFIEQIRLMPVVPCDLVAMELVLSKIRSRAPSSPSPVRT
jgi:8-oxo-dGTP pyrophosphatase MutT (NUDIX family)